MHANRHRLGARFLGIFLLQLLLSGNARGLAAGQTGADDLKSTEAAAYVLCVGSCRGDGTVTVDNILTLVNIALDVLPPYACAQGLPTSGPVTIDLILAAVNNALNECPATSSAAVGVSPAAVMMPSGGQQSFVATVIGTTDTAVTWSVAEGSSGGSVDEQGSYTAPVEPGVYHVLATSHADTTKTAQATVMVSILPPDPAFAPQPLVPPSPDTETNTDTVPADTTGSVSLPDGTRVNVPPMPGPVTVSVTRSAENVDAISVFGQEPTGSPRTVIYTGDAAALDFVPTITIPASEAGTITALNVARIGPLVVNGSLQNDTVTFLPATRDNSGNILVRDVHLRGAARLAAAAPSGGLGAAGDAVKSVRTIYNLSTYQAQLNWSIAPQLVRMVPDASMPEKRRPLSSLSATERDAVLRKPIQNVIVLVHGHNEAEKLGFEAKQIPAIWGYEYKRNVWTFIYQWFLDATAGYDAYAGCTAFYEFIYPSYRPVFEGQGALGAALASALGADEKLKKQAAKYNLFFVAHSMGGLVSRAAINQLPFAVAPNFEKLITWGTPHHGSPVMTFRYLLTSGYNLYVPGMCVTGSGVPLEIFNEMAIYNRAVQGLAVDSPGWRDNRWDNFKPLNLAGIGWSRAPWQIGDDVRWDPARNEDLYSAPLLHFNQNDRFYLSDKYVAFDGLTKQLAPIDLTSCSAMWSFYKAAPIAKGAGINRWTYNSSETLKAYPNTPEVKQSDGAVSVDSMVGLGVFASYNTYPLDDVDHEQYFGAPHNGNITPENKDKGDDTAIRTLSTLNLKNAPNKQCDCPTLALTGVQQSPPDVTITGKVTWPGDASPGPRVVSVALVRLEGASRVVVPASSQSVQPDGTISGTFPASAFAGLALAPLFTAVLVDGGELSVSAPVEQTGTATDTFKGLAGSIDGYTVTPPVPALTIDVGVEAEQVELFPGEPATGPWEFEWPDWQVGSSGDRVTFNVWFKIRDFGAANWFPAQFCTSLRCYKYELVGFLKGVASAWDSDTRVEGTNLNQAIRIDGVTVPHEGGVGPGHGFTIEVWYRIRETTWYIDDPTDTSTRTRDNEVVLQTTVWSN